MDEPPEKPNDADCCNSGCNPCVFDVYELQLKKYNERRLQKVDKTTSTETLKNCLSTTKYTKFILQNRIQDASNTFLFTFSYAEDITNVRKHDVFLDIKPGQHLLLRAPQFDACLVDENKHFTRAYTPISLDNTSLSFTVLIKLYENGLMSKLLRNLPDRIETNWRGPYGDYDLLTHSTIKGNHFNNLLCICQGVGVAPIYSVVDSLLKDGNCEMFIKLFLCCRSSEEIVLRDELQEFSKNWNFTYEIFLSRENNSDMFKLKYNEVVHFGRINADIINSYFAKQCRSVLELTKTLICGGDTFNRDVMEIIQNNGLPNDNVFVFH